VAAEGIHDNKLCNYHRQQVYTFVFDDVCKITWFWL